MLADARRGIYIHLFYIPGMVRDRRVALISAETKFYGLRDKKLRIIGRVDNISFA